MMSAAPSLASVESPSRRKLPRYAINVPLDIIILRSGIPDSIPGRCTDISESGLGAVIAGELSPDQHLAIELKLPDVALPLRARAMVRHYAPLRCGLQFVSLPEEQREMVRFWLHRSQAQPVPANPSLAPQAFHPLVAMPAPKSILRRIRVGRRHFVAIMALLLALAAAIGWYWQSSWKILENSALASEISGDSPLQVSWDTMRSRINYRLDPSYPEAAKRAKSQGLVILDVVISADGSVKTARPIAGPDLLAQSAVDAVHLWKFDPYRANGHTTEVETTIAVEFRLE